MTVPPYEWPTRITGLLTRPIVAFVKATSSSVELRPYCAAMHWYPSACRGTINLLKQEPSAQSPWQNTMLGLVCIKTSFSSLRKVLLDSPDGVLGYSAGAIVDATTFGLK